LVSWTLENPPVVSREKAHTFWCKLIAMYEPFIKQGLTSNLDIIRTYLKIKIKVQGKARNGEKAEHTRSM